MLFFLFLKFNTAFAEGYKLEGESKKVKIDLPEQSFQAEESGAISYEDMTVNAKNIKKVKEKNIIIANDGISFRQGDYLVEADSLSLDLESKIGDIVKGRTEINNWFIDADKITVKFPEKLTATNSFVTTCSLKKPHFRIEAKKVEFFPNSKFIAYQGWIYIGNFRLLPVPIYASYVVPKEDRAPLFPQIVYDEIKGTMLIYGFDYQILDKEDFIFPNASLDILCNFEYSANRGFGINKLRLGYSAFKNKELDGYLMIKDWVNAKYESNNQAFEENHPTALKKNGKGSSFEFETFTNFVSEKGFINYRGDTVIGNSNSKIYLNYKDSDLTKDSDNRYAVEQVRDHYLKSDISIKQKIWHSLFLDYRFIGLNEFTNGSLDKLIQKNQDEIEESVNEAAAEIDTRSENVLKLTHKDNLHEASFIFKNIVDLKPEIASIKRDTKSLKNRELSFTLDVAPIALKLKAENLSKDTWRLKDISKKENYIAEELDLNNFSLNLGTYPILFGFRHGYNFEKIERDYKNFSVPAIITNQYETRLSRLTTRSEKESSYSLSAILTNDAIKFYGVKIEPTYGIKFKKFITNDLNYGRLTPYVDAIIHDIKINIPWLIYDNRSYEMRSVDTIAMLEPFFRTSIFTGGTPRDQIKPITSFETGASTSLGLGNMLINYSSKWDLDYYVKEKFTKHINFTNRGSISIERQKLFDFAISHSSEWTTAKSDPNISFIQIYLTDWAFVKAELSLESRLNLFRDYANEALQQSQTSNSVRTKLESFGVKGIYERRLIKVKDEIRLTSLSDEIENLLELGYSIKINQINCNTSIQYKNQYDETRGLFKDSTLSFEFIFEDKSSVKKQEEPINIEKRETTEDDIDLLIRLREDKPQRSLLELGNKKKEKIKDPDVWSLSFKTKVIHDAQHLEQLGVNFENYMNSWKRFILDSSIKLGKYLELAYKIEKRRDTIAQDFEQDTREFKIRLGFGKQDYEKYVGLEYKDNLFDNRIDTLCGTFDVNMHCTTLKTKFGRKRVNNEFNWVFGIEFSIMAFPEKAFGADFRENGIDNIKFGL